MKLSGCSPNGAQTHTMRRFGCAAVPAAKMSSAGSASVMPALRRKVRRLVFMKSNRCEVINLKSRSSGGFHFSNLLKRELQLAFAIPPLFYLRGNLFPFTIVRDDVIRTKLLAGKLLQIEHGLPYLFA